MLPFLLLRSRVLERDLKGLLSRSFVAKNLLEDLHWLRSADFRHVKLVFKPVIRNLVGERPELVELGPTPLRVGVTLVPIVLVFERVIQHHPVWITSLGNSNPDRTGFRSLQDMEVSLGLPSSIRHVVCWIVPVGLILLRMVEHGSVWALSISPGNSHRLTWNRLVIDQKAHVVLPSCEGHRVCHVVPVRLGLVRMVEHDPMGIPSLTDNDPLEG